MHCHASRNTPCRGLGRFLPQLAPSILPLLTAFSLSLCLVPLPSTSAGRTLTLLRFAEELLLGRAVSLQCCLVSMSSLHPRSAAQLGSRAPAQANTFSAPSGLPPSDVPGAPGEHLLKQAQAISNVASSQQRHFFPAVAFLLSEKDLHLRITSYQSQV